MLGKSISHLTEISSLFPYVVFADKVNDEIKWRDEFNEELFFSHGKTNLCRVAIGFYGSKTIEQINKISDKSGRILLVEATVDDTVFVLINIYNANTESEQLETLLDLVSIIDKVKDIQSKNIVLGGDFNVISDISLECLGGNPCSKKKSITKLIQIKEKFNICDIWRIRNPKIKRFTFRRQDLFKEDLITFLFLTFYKNWSIKQMCWQLFLLITHLCCFP